MLKSLKALCTYAILYSYIQNIYLVPRRRNKTKTIKLFTKTNSNKLRKQYSYCIKTNFTIDGKEPHTLNSIRNSEAFS